MVILYEAQNLWLESYPPWKAEYLLLKGDSRERKGALGRSLSMRQHLWLESYPPCKAQYLKLQGDNTNFKVNASLLLLISLDFYFEIFSKMNSNSSFKEMENLLQ